MAIPCDVARVGMTGAAVGSSPVSMCLPPVFRVCSPRPVLVDRTTGPIVDHAAPLVGIGL